MPYASNDDLPPAIRRHLPEHAQDIFREAFNNAWRTYGAREPYRREEIAHRVAWAAVKKSYRKVGDDWVPYGHWRGSVSPAAASLKTGAERL
ncbi:MAG TPA: ChaB family protein [Hyphomicrobiaceae bacterium]|jgi:cation transport regulator|nr:ChaB family protein [Hyphomicrobiaceae bacterium]